MPTQAPTGSIELSWLMTPILARLPGIAGGGADFDDAVVNLGHFLREELLHELGVGAAEEDLRPAHFAADGEDQAADAVADADHFARDLLVAADDALGAAQVDDDMAELDPLDDAGDDLVGAILELFILALALGVADLLEDDLLGGLRGDAAELDRGQRIDDIVADHGVLLELLRALQIDLLEIILDLFDHLDHAPQAQGRRFPGRAWRGCRSRHRSGRERRAGWRLPSPR